MTGTEKKTGMTDAECEYWDDYYTGTAFEPGPNLLKQGVRPVFAQIAHKSQTKVINGLIREKL